MKMRSRKLTALIMACLMILSSNMTAFAAAATEPGKFYADYSSWADVEAAGAALVEEIEEEGIVLMKNNGVLPFSADVKNISVFGARTASLQTGGGGSGSGSGVMRTMQESLEEAGYTVNPKLVKLYADNQVSKKLSTIGATNDAENVELPVSVYTDSVVSTYKTYGDAALVMFSRTGAEMGDLLRDNVVDHADASEHYLELNDNEKALLAHMKEQKANGTLGSIVVIINSSNAMELGCLEDDPAIDAIVWIGHTGVSGIMALGRVLNGSVNPSGRLVDVYPADFTQDPTWYNFGDNSQNGDNTVIYTPDGTETIYRTLTYKEGIYVGYRWYETAATVDGYFAAGNQPKDGFAKGSSDLYYNRTNGVVYPFGFGLSYTTFDWSNFTVTENGEKITASITVKNTGKMAGKDVVELYVHAPYIAGGIEKSEAALVDYVKTDLLQPGQSATYTMTFDRKDLASYDYNDANGNGHKGYELDEGDYILAAQSDSHTVKASATLTLAAQNYDGEEPLFSGDDTNSTTGAAATGTDIAYTSRANFALPATVTAAERTFTAEAVQLLDDQTHYAANMDKESDPWYVGSVPEGWTQASEADVAARVNGKAPIQLSEMSGVAYDDPQWTVFMNQLTYDELVTLINNGYHSNPAMPCIGKPYAIDQDGPAQLKPNAKGANEFGNGETGTFWCSETVIGATWNVDLALRQGLILGNESLFNGQNGWYGAAMNTHRSPFGGRVFEYYSGDGVQGGKIAAAVTRGVQEKGMHVYMKHFVMNDQETDRFAYGGVCTWATEQAMREIYFKPFEKAIKEANANGTMCAFNRIGLMPTAESYNLYIELLEKQWGFDGLSVTDSYSSNINNAKTFDYAWPSDMQARLHMIPLGKVNLETNIGRFIEGSWDESANMVMVPAQMNKVTDNENAWDVFEFSEEQIASPTQWFNVRDTAQRLLYVSANTNMIVNGHDFSGFASEVAATVGKNAPMNVSMAIDLASNDVTYSITSGKLPEGVNLDSHTGVISGVPTENGEYAAKVTVQVDTWITKTANVTLNVVDALTYEGTDLGAVEAGTAFEGKVSTAFLADEKYTSVSYALAAENNLPEGVELAADGTLSGVPTIAGTYTFDLIARGAYATADGESFDDVAQTFVMTVIPEQHTVTIDLNHDGQSYAITVADGEQVPAQAVPTYAGHIFTGWYADASAASAFDFGKEVIKPVTVYAGWYEIPAEEEPVQETISTEMIAAIGAAALALIALIVAASKKKSAK